MLVKYPQIELFEETLPTSTVATVKNKENDIKIMENAKLMQPIEVQNESNTDLSIQLTKVTITDHRGERETTPEICLLVSEGENEIPIMFTPKQAAQLIKQLNRLLKENNIKIH